MPQSTAVTGAHQVAPGIDRPLFGQLVRQIVSLSTEELNDCLEEQSQSGDRLGAILKQRGHINDEQILEILRQQAQWIVQTNRGDYLTNEEGKYPAVFSLCLPAYNEADVIGDTVDSACVILNEIFEDFEVIVVNDGSKDRTAEIVTERSQKDPRVRLVDHEQNKGYGGAVTSGLRAAQGDLVAFSDSDGQFSFLEFPQLLRELEGRDMVIGYRFRRADPFIRKCNAYAWGTLVWLILGVRVRDLDCAFKIFRREVLEGVEMTSVGACINAEIMSQCVHGGAKFTEVPVSHFPRTAGAPTGANIKVIAKAFRELPKLWKYRKKSQKVQRSTVAATTEQPSSA